MAIKKKAVQKRTKGTGLRAPLVGARPMPAFVVAAAPVEPPAAVVWVPGPAYVQPLGHLARAVEEKRGRDALAAIEAAREAVEVLAGRAVRLARAEGATWAEIGAVNGTSRQAAHLRWAPRRPPEVRDGQACHYAGDRDACQQVATTARGAVPLCEPCEAASSSLKRLPRGRLPRTVAGST
jgi:hypothetical protein